VRQLSKKLFKKASAAVETDEDLIILTLFGSILASFGIVLGNDFILIGSMVIAPFFHPILSVATFIAGGKPEKVFKSILSLIFITIAAFTISYVTYVILSQFREVDLDYLILGTQIEYFIVAIILGSIGALLWVWPRIPNISAGLSIGISLVPPIANAAKSLYISDWSTFQASLLAYSLNLSGLIIGAIITIFLRNRVMERKLVTVSEED
jgi:uncharacterized hydrophobic protein (TIGR00271 family)